MQKRLPVIFASIWLYSAMAAAEAPDQQPVDVKNAVAAEPAVMPQPERDYIAIVEKARKQYEAGRSTDARKGARVNLQIDVHQFMGLSHSASNWTGIYKGGKLTDEGHRSVVIEIAPAILIATWENRYSDGQSDTMIQPRSPIGQMLSTLTIGTPVIFSANLIGSVVSTDDDMVRRPQIIAKFSDLKKAD